MCPLGRRLASPLLKAFEAGTRIALKIFKALQLQHGPRKRMVQAYGNGMDARSARQPVVPSQYLSRTCSFLHSAHTCTAALQELSQ